MDLFDTDPLTRLPVAKAELRVIPEFKELIRRKKAIDGDADGRKKTLNELELGFVYYMCKYDTRFKILKGKEKEKEIKKILKLPVEWEPDDLVNKACDIYADLQKTESTDLVGVLGESILSLTSFAKTANEQLRVATLMMSDDVKRYMEILDKIPGTIDKLRQAKELLNKEQEALAKGRKGRTMNKFEEPD